MTFREPTPPEAPVEPDKDEVVDIVDPPETTPDDIQLLLDMLSYRRCHESMGEKMFYEDFIQPLGPVVYQDDKGDAIAYTLCTDLESKVLFSCHIDTRHNPGGDLYQNMVYDAKARIIEKDDKECLGADDGAGVWLMLQMYEAGVPGTYIFHRGEECGGIGSAAMSHHHPAMLKQFDYAIAFDRKDTCSVITHQGFSERTASDEFAQELCKRINVGHPYYDLKPDHGGVFTDTANYVDEISECTNVSAGYYNEHTAKEYLDVDYLLWLRDRCIEVFYGIADNPLPHVRPLGRSRPHWLSDDYVYEPGGHNSHYYGSRKARKKDKKKRRAANNNVYTFPTKTGMTTSITVPDFDDPDYVPTALEVSLDMTYQEVCRWVGNASTADVADLLINFAEQIVQLKGYVPMDGVVEYDDDGYEVDASGLEADIDDETGDDDTTLDQLNQLDFKDFQSGRTEPAFDLDERMA